MARKTIAQHREEILSSLAAGYPAHGTVNCVQGQRWREAANRLASEGLVKVIRADDFEFERYDRWVCIPPGAEWDTPTQSFRRQPDSAVS